ncbi:hypothetical protein GCM10025734_09670 [Kitasatospora paranensis]
MASAFGGRLHSGYLYGSIPRGTAVPGVSDLDLLLALREEPTAADRADAQVLGTALDAAFPQIDGVGVLLFSVRTLLSDLERHDLGFFVACLCTPLLGADLAERLPRYRPTGLVARETNGDLGLALPAWRARAVAAATAEAGASAQAEAEAEAERRRLGRAVGRRLVRTGFTLVMPRWGGWTSDLDTSAAVFGRYYPERAEQMRVAAATGRRPSGSPDVLGMLLDDLAPWLAAEYTALHGVKAPRP